MALLEAVFADTPGQTPQDAERRRRLAKALLAQAEAQEVKHPLQGVAKLLATGLGRWNEAKADEADKAAQTATNEALIGLMGGGGYSAPSGVSPTPAGAPDTGGSTPETAQLESYIRDAATKRNIDPNVAVRVARSEGLAPGVWQSNVVNNGRRETSYGPFQLLVGGGLGDKFQRLYGKSPADRSTVYQQIDFALDEAARGGWSPWYGAAKVGVGSRTGLENARPLGVQQGVDPTTTGSIRVGGILPEQTTEVAPATEIAGPELNATSPIIRAMLGLSGPDTASRGGPYPAAPQSGQFPAAPPQPTQAGVGMARQQALIAQLLRNPATAAIGQRLAASMIAAQMDPAAGLDAQLKRAQLENLTNPRPSASETLARERFEWEKDKSKSWEKLDEDTLYNPATGETRDTGPQVPKFNDVSSLRKEVQLLPSYKNLAQAAPIYKTMMDAAGRDSKAADLNLVYGLGKIFDPGSVVREGEMVMVKDTASLPDWLVGAINSLNGGQRLQPATRKAIMDEAYSRYQSYRALFDQDAKFYGGIVQRGGFDAADVLPSFEEMQPWEPATRLLPNKRVEDMTDEELEAIINGR